MSEELNLQVANQYRAVAALCRNIATVHDDLAPIIEAGSLPTIRDIQGERSAEIMEVLGNILNNMDAVLEEDEWMTPIFEKAQKLWPVAPDPRIAQLEQALREAAAGMIEAREALHFHYVEWDGEPEDAVPLQLARSRCDATLAKINEVLGEGNQP